MGSEEKKPTREQVELAEKVKTEVDLVLIRLGADFETHGGKRVRYLGTLDTDYRFAWPVAIGSEGVIEMVTPSNFVLVKWSAPGLGGMHDNPAHLHEWEDLEVLG